MKIAIATDWFAPRRGGIETQLVGLARGLAARGHEVHVITSTPQATDGEGYRVRRIASAVLPGLDLALTPGVVRELRRLLQHEYDVVHAHASVVSPVAYAAAAVAMSMRRATVLSFHSVLRMKRVLLGAANWLFHLDQSAVLWAAVSRKVADQAHLALRDAQVEVLPNAIDLDFWRQAPLRRSNGSVQFISAMRLHSKKRPRELLRAFADVVREQRTGVTLTFVGDGPEASVLRKEAAELGLTRERQIRFQPWCSPTELRAHYAASDAFVSACEREAFGIAALEARAAGLPIVAMRAAGSTEFLRHETDALLCNNLEELRGAMARLTRDRAMRVAMAEAQPALDVYDWPAVLLRHESAYRRAQARISGATTPAS